MESTSSVVISNILSIIKHLPDYPYICSNKSDTHAFLLSGITVCVLRVQHILVAKTSTLRPKLNVQFQFHSLRKVGL